MKGINREVIPYTVQGMLDATGQKIEVFSEHMTGIDFYLDPTVIDGQSSERIRGVLRKALEALERVHVK